MDSEHYAYLEYWEPLGNRVISRRWFMTTVGRAYPAASIQARLYEYACKFALPRFPVATSCR